MWLLVNILLIVMLILLISDNYVAIWINKIGDYTSIVKNWGFQYSLKETQIQAERSKGPVGLRILI